MEWPRKIVSLLKANDICSISFIPDSVIGQILKEAEKDPFFHFTTLARPDKKVIVLDGDGAILMNLNSLTTTAAKAPANLVHIIWDNEQYQITGGQLTHTSGEADIETIARGAGFKQALTVDTFAAFKKAVPQILIHPGPWILVVKTDSSKASGRPPKSPVYIKNQFIEELRKV